MNRAFKKGKIVLTLILVVSTILITIIFLNRNKSISLLQAYNIAHKEILQRTNHAELCLITSVDEPDSTIEQGKDGKRRYWNMIFADSDSLDKQYIISIRDKAVEIEPIQQDIDRTQFINMDDLVLTSEKAVSSAIADYGLLPGQEWAIGYHFVLRSFDNNIDFQVVGLGTNNKILRIAYDGNGQFIKKLEPGDG